MYQKGGNTNVKLIAIDMDEVLTETIKGVLKFHNNKLDDRTLKYNNIVSYNLWEIPGFKNLTIESCLEYFNSYFNSPEFITAEPIQGAREKLEYFKSLGYKFVVITGRNIVTEKASKIYLETYFPDIFEGIYFCGYNTDHQRNKYSICKELGITKIIEDHLENSIKYTHHGIEVILIDKPRNQNYNPQIHKHITKVKNWSEIILD